MKNSIVFMVITAISLLASCAVVHTGAGTDRQTAKIIVSGNGAVDLDADTARFNVTISQTANTTGEAMSRTNAKISQTLAILRDLGVKDEDLHTTEYSISTQYNWTDGKQIRIGERVAQSIAVSVHNIDTVAKIFDHLSQVSEISINSLSFDASDKTEALSKARELAYKDALEKAESYAKSSGCSISRPLLINESFSTYNARTYDEAAPMAMKAVGNGFSPTEMPTGGVKVSVSLQCEFEIK